MYYKEEWINGILYWKATPNGEWIAFTMQQYKDKCLKQDAELKNLSKANVSSSVCDQCETMPMHSRNSYCGCCGDKIYT